MGSLNGKSMVVIGGSRGVGRLTLQAGKIARLTLFVKPDAPALFAPLGLPQSLDQ